MRETGDAAYRILDASANRASEGMRTIEEYVRFVLDDPQLTATAKALRHEFAAAIRRLPRVMLVGHRDTDADVGTSVETSSEYERVSLGDVLRAAMERVQQSLRVLEEYGKTVEVLFAREIESVRYRVYSFHQTVELAAATNDRRHRLQRSQLYVLMECLTSQDDFTQTFLSLAEAGVDIIQLRDKHADDRTLFERARVAAKLARELDVLFIVNDRADIAAASGADGVHVGQSELPAAAAKKAVGFGRLVGVSTHDLDQVQTAIADGADYIGCGPTFPGQTKSFEDFPGCDFLREVHEGTKETPRPAFAIGGIDSNNIDRVLECGFHRVAISGAVMNAADPVAAARHLKQLLQ